MGHPRINLLWSGDFFVEWIENVMNTFEQEARMYFYWRIMEELKYLGEVLVFHDPSFKREYRLWVRKNQAGLDVIKKDDNRKILDDFDPFGIIPSLN